MAEITDVLKKYGIRADKRLSQNFLIDEFVINKIIKAAEIDENTTVIEIGSGAGSLTKELLRSSAFVYAIELDSRLSEILKIEYGCDRLEIINGDIMKTDINPIIARETGKGRKVKVCANLPYHITTPATMRLLEETIGLTSLTLMMQKEVADRLLSSPGSKEYGAITPMVSYYADVSFVANVPPNCFIPRPGVYSSVVNFKILEEKRVSPKNEGILKKVVKAAFGQRRKTLLNALSSQIPLSKEQLLECFDNPDLTALGITPSIRGETLGLQEFTILADAVYEKLLKNSAI